MSAMLANQAMNYLASGRSPKRMGNAHINLAPYQTLPVADGWLIVAVGNDGQFARLCGVLGLEPLARDPRFATNPGRVTNRVDLERDLGAKTRLWKRDDLLAALGNGGRSCRADQHDRRSLRRSPVQGARHADRASGAPGIRSPIVMSESPLAFERRSPRLGEHQAEILREIGLE